MTVTFVTPKPGADIKNILIYGPPGSGKSTAACTAPGPILYLNAEGEARLRYARRHNQKTDIREVTLDSKKVLDDVYLYLKKGDGGEKTLVVDTLGEMYQALLKDLAKDELHPTLPEHGEVQTTIRRFVRAVRDLPQNVILVAHQDSEINKQTGETITRPSTLIGSQKLMAAITGMVDVVAYAAVREGEGGAPEYVAQLVAGAGRDAKSSGNALGKVRAMDITEWIATSSAATTNKTSDRKAA